MKPFLQELSEYFFNKYGEKTTEFTFIFPNKRAGLFFRYYLSQSFAKPVWSPDIQSINSFFHSLSSLQPADNYSVLFELYKICSNVNITHGNFYSDTFDKFFFWGNMLLSDFDDIDKSLVNARELFTNIANIKNIDDHFRYLEPEQLEILKTFWEHLNISKFSDAKTDFIKIWDVLFPVYEKLTEKLLQSGLGYEGMIYRQVIDMATKNMLDNIPDNLAFAGFNTFNNAEAKLVEYCRDNCNALFFWDVDEIFAGKENSETFKILRQNTINFPPPQDFHLSLNDNKNKNIQIIGIPQEVGQVKAAADFINKFYKQNPDNNTSDEINSLAIVMPAEHLLFPLINSLPVNVTDLNITMGFPLKNTQLAELIDSVLSLQTGIRTTKSGKVKFYYSGVFSILKHPLIYRYASENIDNFINNAINSNDIYIAEEDVLKLSSQSAVIFGKREHLLDYFINILLSLYGEEILQPDEIEKEFIYKLYTELKRLKEIINSEEIEISEESITGLIRDVIRNIRIPFSGEPLAGLQIMGVMETRCLDFKNIIILSMNEGKWPPSFTTGSFIPYSVRRGFGMPTYKDKETIYSYNFYRLLQRSENVFIFYNTETGYNGEGEKSRYLYQLKYDSDFEIRESFLKLPVKPSLVKEIRIENNDFIFKKLSRYLTGSPENFRFSPTAINTFLDCRLKFYFSYIAEIKEAGTLLEDIDAAAFGNLLHYSVEILYKTISGNENKTITEPDFVKMNEIIDSSVSKAFLKNYNSGNAEFEFTGNDLLVRNIIFKYIRKILEIDKVYAPFRLVSLEDNFDFKYDIDLQDKGLKAGLKGRIDRIDQKENIIRIIDYKTGKTEKRITDIESLFERENDKRNKAAFQLLFYSLLYETEKKVELTTVIPGIYDIRSMFSENFDHKLFIKKGNEPEKFITNADDILPEFKKYLVILLNEIFSAETVFNQTDNAVTCSYCPYNIICNKIVA